MDALCIFFKLFYNYFDRVRNLLVIIKQNLFTNYLRYKEPGRFIRPLVLTKIGRNRATIP